MNKYEKLCFENLSQDNDDISELRSQRSVRNNYRNILSDNTYDNVPKPYAHHVRMINITGDSQFFHRRHISPELSCMKYSNQAMLYRAFGPTRRK